MIKEINRFGTERAWTQL